MKLFKLALLILWTSAVFLSCNGTIQEDCIDNCNPTGGIAIPSQNTLEEPCSCDCFEGHIGDQCETFVFPEGFMINQIKLKVISLSRPATDWDDTGNNITDLPDPFYRLSLSDTFSFEPEFTFIGNTEFASDLDYQVETTFQEGVLPLYLPMWINMSMSLQDYDTDGDHDSMILHGFVLTNNIAYDNAGKDTLTFTPETSSGPALEYSLIVDWVY